MEQINNFEKHISQNGTKILKFYLHMSKEEQRERLLKRLENGEDNWKFSLGDLKERELWGDYIKYYQNLFTNSETLGSFNGALKCSRLSWGCSA